MDRTRLLVQKSKQKLPWEHTIRQVVLVPCLAPTRTYNKLNKRIKGTRVYVFKTYPIHRKTLHGSSGFAVLGIRGADYGSGCGSGRPGHIRIRIPNTAEFVAIVVRYGYLHIHDTYLIFANVRYCINEYGTTSKKETN